MSSQNKKITDWTSGNEKVDDFIQKMQLNTGLNDVLFEWIPYSQFSEITEIEVALKCLHNSRNFIELVINKVEKYPSRYRNFWFITIYGISQNPDTNDYILVQNNSINLTNWASENEKIDDFIQERQFKIRRRDVVFEWIPYNQFNEIKETGKNSSITVYSAIWKDGPLYWNEQIKKKYTRNLNKEIALKCLHNTQNSVEFVMNEVGKYHIRYEWVYSAIWKDGPLYWNEQNKKYARNLNKEIALKCLHNTQNSVEFIINEVKKYHIRYEWAYSAIWKDGPLHWNEQNKKYTRNSNREIALKCLHNTQNLIEFVINKVIKDERLSILYGISQNPDTNDYVLAQNNLAWTTRNKKIDDFIQEVQLKINDTNTITFEWVQYDQFNEIEETGRNGSVTLYSALWKDGPLYNISLKRDSNKKVALKCLHNSQNRIKFVINEVKKYQIENGWYTICGISQDPYTNDYILNYTEFVINEVKSFSKKEFIKETNKNSFATTYSAIWREGPIDNIYKYKYRRNPNKNVFLKQLHNSHNLTQFVINEAKKYSTNSSSFLVIYGISQNPDTKDYILVQNKLINFNNYITGKNSQNHINELLKEVKAYSTKPTHSSILKVYGISQEPCTKNYIIILHYAAGGSFDHWVNINENYKNFNWKKKIQALLYIASGLRELHDEQIVHRDLHTRNILFNNPSIKPYIKIYISDMGLCGEVATERQPFDNRAHDCCLTLDIYNGIRPEINEKAIPRCYINLMKNCWDSNPKNRPDATVLSRALSSISINNLYKAEIEEAEKHRILHLSSSKVDRQVNTHPQAIYTSRLLNPFTENLPKYIDDNSECLDCAILDE
ncbi:kinase-like domain-containing protein [Rhizophagus irregularis DAOM 181602=DAOM 197198]|nr:kinase-like domain-containing protein [Rhizophagus irregularis DAOM 181602=DAOM 197198]